MWGKVITVLLLGTLVFPALFSLLLPPVAWGQTITPIPASTATPVPTSAVTESRTESHTESDTQSDTESDIQSEQDASVAPGADSVLMGRYTFEECNRANPEIVRREMAQIARRVLIEDMGEIDSVAMVERKWAELNISGIFDAEVRRAVAAVKAEPREMWDFSLFITGWVPAQAEELAERVIVDVLTSDPFTQALDDLAEALAVELGDEIEIMSARSASAMLLCLQAYVGNRYADNMYEAFADQTLVQVDAESLTPTSDSQVSLILQNHGMALSGGAVLILTGVSRQIIQSLGRTLSGRIVGRVITRIAGRAGASLVPYAGWILGLGLIVFDLTTGMEGALPQIENALLEEEVKIAIRSDIAHELRTGLAGEVDLLADTLALTLMNEWSEFCNIRPGICLMSAENSGYRNILAVTSLSEINSLERLTQTYLDLLGRQVLDQAIVNGDFYRLASVPPDAIGIFAATRSVETTLQWVNAVAATGVPNGLQRLVAHELYNAFTPDDLASAELATIITIEDNEVLARLIDLEVGRLSLLLSLIGDVHLQDIVRRTSPAELDWLIDFLPELDAADRAESVQALAGGMLAVTDLRNRPEPSATETSATADDAAESGVALVSPGGTPAASGPSLPGNGVDSENAAPGIDVQWPLIGIWSANSILFAAILAFVIIVTVGAVIAARQNGTEQ